MSNIYVNIAMGVIEENIALLVDESIGAEIYVNGGVLDEYLMSHIQNIGEKIQGEGLKVNVHGPYVDLNPGYSDNFIRESVVRRIMAAIDIAAALSGGTLVLHSGFRPGLNPEKHDLWLRNSLRSWDKILKYSISKGIAIAIENIRDDSPGMIRRILDYFNSDYLTHCFDIGHFNIFADQMSLSDWFDVLGDKLAVVHIHDNDGKSDRHLPLGHGSIDFLELFSELGKIGFTQNITIENNTKEDLVTSVKYLRDNFDF